MSTKRSLSATGRTKARRKVTPRVPARSLKSEGPLGAGGRIALPHRALLADVAVIKG